MAAASKDHGHLCDIEITIDTKAALEGTVFILIEEHCHLNVLGYTKLVDNAIQMFRKHIILLHHLIGYYTDNATAIQIQLAVHQSLSQYFVLIEGLGVKSVINNLRIINSFFHELPGYVHCLCRSAGILEHSGIMYHARI